MGTENINSKLRRPYTKATIGNMLPAIFFNNVASNMLPIVALV
jgi:hypothetical protein